jgi:hypothetical protein
MSKGSGRRKQDITDEQMEQAWNAIFAGHPNEEQFETIKQKPPVVKEDDYGNELPKPKANDPDRFYDESGDA